MSIGMYWRIRGSFVLPCLDREEGIGKKIRNDGSYLTNDTASYRRILRFQIAVLLKSDKHVFFSG